LRKGCRRVAKLTATLRIGKVRGRWRVAKSAAARTARRRQAAERSRSRRFAFLASEPEHLGGFLAAPGVGPDQIRDASRDPSFLSGVLDHFSGNEPLLIAFAQHQGIDPTEIERARAAPRRASGNGTCRDGRVPAAIACATPATPRAAPPASRLAFCGTRSSTTLTICHVDCDAFYATIEKRDDPTLADKPLIIGGRQARRRVDRLLHRTNLRHPLGDADVRGTAPLPARHHRPSQHGEIRRRQPARCAR